MTEAWFHSPERIARLQFHAAGWIGTPFFGNGNTRGPEGGVSCQKLASALYRECGCCAVDVPDGPMGHGRFSRRVSLIEQFMDGRSEMKRVTDLRAVRPGDLLGFRIGRVVHHVGILVEAGKFVHVLEHAGTGYGSLSDATWKSRLAAAWRPLGNAKG